MRSIQTAVQTGCEWPMLKFLTLEFVLYGRFYWKTGGRS